MKKSIYIALLASIFISDMANADIRGNKKSVRASNTTKRSSTRGSLRAAAISSSSTSSEGTSKTSSTSEAKDTKTCEKIFYSCMDEKTNEAVMTNELIYNDYSDMLSDIYSGMTAPAFKCIYSNKVKSLYSTYYYGYEISTPMAGMNEKIQSNSIEYYSYLKDNATSVANKRLPVTQVDREVLKFADVKTEPSDMKFATLPDVSYKITTLDTNALFDSNVAYCMDPTQNKELEGCPTLKKSLSDKYKDMDVSLSKTCKDYEVFLTTKLSQAKTSAKDYIIKLKTKISSVIDEYNLKKEAEEELKNLGSSDN